MTTPTLWPRTTLSPRAVTARIMGATASGGRTLTGKEQITAHDAGFWGVQLADIPVASQLQKTLWRTMSALMRGRRGVIDVPFYNTDTAPIAPPPIGGIHFSDGALFSDGAAFSQGGGIAAVLHAGAALGVVQLVLAVNGDGEIQASDLFSVRGRSGYARGYEITSIISAIVSGADVLYTVKVRPPLREAMAAGAEAEFAQPLLTCRLLTDTEMQSAPDDYAGRALGRINFVEAIY